MNTENNTQEFKNTCYVDTTCLPSYEDYVEECEANNVEPDKEGGSDYYEYVYERQTMEWKDFKTNMGSSKWNNKPVVITGSCGTWRGAREICPVYMDNLLAAIMKCAKSVDDIKVKSKDGHIEFIGMHHDGTNNMSIYFLNDTGLECAADNDICNGDIFDDFDEETMVTLLTDYLY